MALSDTTAAITESFFKKSPTDESPDRFILLSILYHPEVARIGERVVLTELAADLDAHLSRAEPPFCIPGRRDGKPLQDPYISRKPLILRAERDGGVSIQRGENRMDVRVNGEPLGDGAHFEASLLRRGVVLELAARVVVLLHEMRVLDEGAPNHAGLVGDSEGLNRLRRDISLVADLDTPVLILGESGAGKELVARAIHAASRRRSKEPVCVNMASLPPALAHGELFGAEKGAFTGSDRNREGYFRMANGGTLFLDEIGETPRDIQTMLLRVLETGDIFPLGRQVPVKSDVRLLTATDANLQRMIEDGRFIAPLYHRLSGYEIRVPPLRERVDDVGRLLFYFLHHELEEAGIPDRLVFLDPRSPPWIPADVVAGLCRYHWPGNIRQLRNIARQIAISNRESRTFKLSDRVGELLHRTESSVVPLSTVRGSGAIQMKPMEPPPRQPPVRKPSEISWRELQTVLRENRWNLKSTAESLGLSRSSLYDLIKKCPQIRLVDDLTEAEIRACYDQCNGDLLQMVETLEVSAKSLQRRLKQLGLSKV